VGTTGNSLKTQYHTKCFWKQFSIWR